MQPREQGPAAAADDDQWLDDVLEQTFPASDPVPMGHKDARSRELASAPTTAEV